MKKITTISSLLLLGALGFLATTWLTPGNLHVDLSDEDFHLYL
ncbi:hypothetical protein ACD591_04000 [Rufibacter glacialis]|uniref:Uncharacterized protein n=1 Tax=Rufibacter glacialis TaxID=1259555 RepID=A0ABV4RBE6_9BACT|nr:hypothetical protein [Rufibacter glacialis]